MTQQILPRLTWRLALLELIVVIACALFAGREWINFDPNRTLQGNEAQWLTSTAAYISHSLRETGTVPLWQPYLSRGEPTFESPFAFPFNPIGTLPSVVMDYPNGIKASAVLYFIFSGIGGWFLGRMLGFSGFGRVLLGLLMIVKGPTHASLGLGFFQLAVTQTYFPWVLGAVIGIVRFPQWRWPVLLFAIILTLQFWQGNIYYTLPSLVMAGLVVLLYGFRRRLPDEREQHLFPIVRNRLIWRRFGFALLFTVGLAAVTLLPIFVNQQFIGRHPTETGAGFFVDPVLSFQQFFNPVHNFGFVGTWNENYYIYSLPLWFALLIFVALPVLERRLPGYPTSGFHTRIWIAGAILFVFFWLWGSGANPIIGWMYENLPLIGRWRVVSRMLAVASFWLVVLAALRVEALWAYFNPLLALAKLLRSDFTQWPQSVGRTVGGFALAIVAVGAVWQVLTTRQSFGSTDVQDRVISACLQWLRTTYPNDVLSVYTRDYYTVTPFIDNEVRISNINADFDPMGMFPTVYPNDLSEAMPRYMIPYAEEEQTFWGGMGYQPIADSPLMMDDQPCVWENPNTLSHAFTIPIDTLNQLSSQPPSDIQLPLDPALTQPVALTKDDWQPGRITVRLTRPIDVPTVLVLQDIAWPGWTVQVNGRPAQVESVGQLLGVMLPINQTEHTIVFEYTAPLLRAGLVITLLTVAVGVLYMLRVDQRLWRRRSAAVPEA